MKGVQHVPSSYGTFRAGPPREAAIAHLAERQHGVISLSQLQLAGLTASAVRNRVAAGRYTPIHRAVYAVGHGRLTMHGRWMAAVLACGAGAVLSHRSAAGLWGIRADNRAKSDVTLPSPSARPRPDIDVHRSAALSDADVTIVDGIPCTTVARTLLDLAGMLDRRGVERAVDESEVQRLFDLRAVEEALARNNGHHGVGPLRSVLAAYESPTLTDNELEEAFYAICRRAGVPKPAVNEWIALADGEVQADFLWRRERLVIETDGWGAHGTHRAFEWDRRRDRRLRLADYETFRFTRREVAYEPAKVERAVRELFALVRRRRRAEAGPAGRRAAQ
ncbi:MAG: type IV toxin-antitoxin system AbiEi family antitoxin domain-containing protein [Thermoleophilaceae bacterium]